MQLIMIKNRCSFLLGAIKVTGSSYVKSFGIVLMILFFMFINGLFDAPRFQIGLNLLIWASFSCAVLFPELLGTRTRLISVCCVLFAETAASLIVYHEINLLYFILVFIYAAAVRQALPVLSVILIIATIYIQSGRQDLFTIFSFLLLVTAFYYSNRSRIQSKELYEMNKRHLTALQESYEELQEASITSMQFAVLGERARIARDIHDAVGHSLTSLVVQIQAMRYMIEQDPGQAKKSLEGMLSVARQGLHDIRISVHALADDQSISGLASMKALLSQMQASASISYTFYSELEDEEIPVYVSVTLFKALQEAITNIIRHSKADQVDVSLRRSQGHIIMRIRDNGTMEMMQTINEGYGIKAMRARLAEKGGSLHYSAAEPQGLELIMAIPLHDS
jgi:Signal transduction histidine kinase